MLETASAAPRLVSASIPGPEGPLEALLREPAIRRGAAVVAHPHPQHGGTMHTKVVHRAARLLADRFALAALRFNFRGVGASAGTYDGGRGETEDLLAAARWMRRREPEGPLVLGGFSFGSVCALRASAVLPADALFLIGIPLNLFREGPAYGGASWAELERGVSCPVVWVHGGRDQYGDPTRARAIAERTGWRLSVVETADHFFTGHLDDFEREAEAGLGLVLRSAA